MLIEEKRKRKKEGHIAKDYKAMQSIKKYKVQKELDNKNKKKNRVLMTILSRYGTRDLPCKFPE